MNPNILRKNIALISVPVSKQDRHFDYETELTTGNNPSKQAKCYFEILLYVPYFQQRCY